MKNKVGLVLALMVVNLSVFGQKLICKKGEVSFFSETPMENISAVNKNAVAVIDEATNGVAVKITVTDFSFPNKLMQEHFNENYMESEKYPTATFSGKINETIDYSRAGSYNVSATGTMNMHGVKKPMTLKGVLKITDSGALLDTNFDIKLADFKIDIPTIVIAKIAEVISVKAHLEFTK